MPYADTVYLNAFIDCFFSNKLQGKKKLLFWFLMLFFNCQTKLTYFHCIRQQKRDGYLKAIAFCRQTDKLLGLLPDSKHY